MHAHWHSGECAGDGMAQNGVRIGRQVGGIGWVLHISSVGHDSGEIVAASAHTVSRGIGGESPDMWVGTERSWVIGGPHQCPGLTCSGAQRVLAGQASFVGRAASTGGSGP
jgi:hypothetical protein